LFHFLLLPELPEHRNGRLPAVQAEGDSGLIATIVIPGSRPGMML
jgi:hypothetical protein